MVITAALAAIVIQAADPSRAHWHTGQLTGFERQRPSKIGFVVDAAAEAGLASGSPLLNIETLSKGVVRSSSVLDVRAPPEVVWSLLLDFPTYPKRVHGISSCEVYDKHWTIGGAQVIGATYEARVGTFKLQYFLEHVYEPLRSTMTWTLDYSRNSDLVDNVGYWHVESKGDGCSRVFYATDMVLPPWIPAPVKMAFIKVAMRRATATLEPACLEVMAAQARKKPQVHFASSIHNRFGKAATQNLRKLWHRPREPAQARVIEVCNTGASKRGM